MKNFGRFLVLCLLAVFGVGALAGEASYTTNTPVQLTGTFGVDVGLDANDKEESYYYLKLDKPIYVVDHEYGQNEANVDKIQVAIGADEFSSKPYKGKRVSVKGSLFHSFTAHHHTRILIWVETAEDVRLVAAP